MTIAATEAALQAALSELATRAATGERSADLLDLARHARDLAELLEEALAELPTDSTIEKLRAAALWMSARLALLERELRGSPIQ